MNTVVYYRRTLYGTVEMAQVRCTQGVRKFAPFGRRGKFAASPRPYVAEADKEMLRRGFTRTKLKADLPRTAPNLAARAIAAAFG